jgi:hypothetical protein
MFWLQEDRSGRGLDCRQVAGGNDIVEACAATGRAGNGRETSVTPPPEVAPTVLAEGLWQWTAFHPEWKNDVQSHVYEADTGNVWLFDPLLPTEPASRGELVEWLRSLGSRLAIIVLLDYHARSACEIASETGARVIAPRAYTSRISCVTTTVEPGEAIAPEVETFPSGRGAEILVWLPRVTTLIAGDVLLGGKRKPVRMCPQSWLDSKTSRAEIAKKLRPLLDLTVDRLLLAHGAPITCDATVALRDALEEASKQ